MKVGSVLRSIRLHKNISKNEVAKITGFNNGYLYKIENNLIEPSLKSLNAYAEAINCPIWKVIYIACKAEELGISYDEIYERDPDWGNVAEQNNDEEIKQTEN